MEKINRKRFLRMSLGGAAGLIAANVQAHQRRRDTIDIGVCAAFENGPMAKAAGCDFLEEGVGKILMPDEPEQAFHQQLDTLRASNALGIRSFIYFLPGQFKAVGPDADHDRIVTYASTAFARAPQTGARYVVFGSGGSRRIPEGFSHEEAKKQFIALCSRLAPEAHKHNMILAVEQLNRAETNFLNTLAQTAEVVRAVDHPGFRMVCDIYHSLREEENPEEVLKFGKYIVHCHIAEKEQRTPPGVMGDDFTPWFKALKKVRYKGGISLECKWTNLEAELGPAVKTLREQWARA